MQIIGDPIGAVEVNNNNNNNNKLYLHGHNKYYSIAKAT